jgi:non-specific serine/threonine protein kinase
MPLTLAISPHGQLYPENTPGDDTLSLPAATAAALERAFGISAAAGMLHLATAELQAALPPEWSYVRDFAAAYLTRLCHTPSPEGGADVPPVPPPGADELAALVLRAPPMRGLEYLSGDVLAEWWGQLDRLVREEMRAYPGGAHEYLRAKNPLWRLVGRVTLHLAENKRDPEFPFAFMATYAQRLSAKGRVQHLPLSKALEQYSGAKDRAALVNLLSPLQQASETSALVKELLDSRSIYRALAWTAAQAYRFLREIPALEASGLIVRVPDWWSTRRPPRPQVSVKIGKQAAGVGVEALLDFSVETTLDGQPLTAEELAAISAGQSGLVSLRGQWVEVDGEKLRQALEHWKQAEREVGSGGVNFFEAMRLLSGVDAGPGKEDDSTEAVREWSGLTAGDWLAETLRGLTDPASADEPVPPGLTATLRPYQRVGFHWLHFATRLRLGVCLADDMGLGKTIQVLALLLALRDEVASPPRPSLLVVPASLIANWKAEIARFAGSLRVRVAHPSEEKLADLADASAWSRSDLVITTYGMLSRLESLRTTHWGRVILDEAQAIKNPGSRQTRAVKGLRADARVALTGTPVENRLSDLWSIFDFLNPGLLGSAKDFSRLAGKLAERGHNAYEPLRALTRPYILRRLKTDKAVIGDLPEKTEVKAYCHLTKAQAALYQQSVRQLGEELDRVDGIQRRRLVLAYLMRFKQICNHPSQWLADGGYDPAASGKFSRLAEICDELGQRQEKVLVFTQFREIAEPLAAYLSGVFGRPGLVLHGQTTLPKRREMVEAFQRDGGPPFFVLSLKAGGTGLNLTAASQVIHFDRWWNPAVENQATDRAFRIGQKRNVLVHKFVCRGTIEDRIDQMIDEKSALARQLVDGDAGKMLTEMNNDELLRFVALDVHRAVES